MTVELTEVPPAGSAERLDNPSDLEELRNQIRSAERRMANLQFALATNRRIGIAIGVLMWQRRLTEDQAFALLRTHSQHGHVKLRDLAESVIFTGTL
jgi:AmiR/NasT family two-component response regulator